MKVYMFIAIADSIYYSNQFFEYCVCVARALEGLSHTAALRFATAVTSNSCTIAGVNFAPLIAQPRTSWPVQ